MKREVLRGYLHDFPLVQAIEQKKDIDKTAKDLLKAMGTIKTTTIDDSVISVIGAEHKKYQEISKNYSILLENAWGITWHEEEIIRKYTRCLDDDIDKLPENIQA